MKKIILTFLYIFICLISASSALAYEYPADFFNINPKYEEAIANNNHADIIKYGKELISITKDTPDCFEKGQIMLTRLNQVGISYAELGDYENSTKAFEELYGYALQYDEEYAISAQARINQYTSAISIYTDKGASPFYGAKNEKENGILFGTCSNGATRSKLNNESMVLTYQELGQDLITYNEGVMKDAAAKGLAVEYALNCPKQAEDIKNIDKMTSYLKQISEMLNKYPNVPVYLRFAAEFDIWENLADADSFKYAFRYVSNYFKQRNPNVAMVWSPNSASNWTIDIDNYYPGDEYVDWIGISLYARKYFQGRRNQSETNEIVFETGINSNPVIAIKDIVEKYGNRKPIMLSEFGCGHNAVKLNEDTSDFAYQRLREMLTYLPMVYPQIKVMAYFDWYDGKMNENDNFSLSSNTKLQNEFIKLTKGARFIQDEYENTTDFCYRKVGNGTSVEGIFPVSCYVHKYNTNVKSVTYFIDDKYVAMSYEIPYSTYIDASNFPGAHKLKAIAEFSDGTTLVTESPINISNTNSNITVEISDRKINFDQEPIIYNDRTMVPMRKIFEELGADVTWNGDTQTVTGKKGDRTVKVAINSKTMYINSKKVLLDTAPIILASRTLVPVRAIAEGLGCDVNWNGNSYLVSITPKIFKWSEWSEYLPNEVDNDLYYIEEREEYRLRTRKKEYFTSDRKLNYANYVETETSYGNWSEWQDKYISPSNDLEVDTRTQSSPKKYHYAHYCTGNISDTDNRYKTRDYWWHDECTYHDLGWFDSPLSYSEDSTVDYAYYVNGEKYRCSTSCYRWYLIETSGGDYTQYRSRPIYKEYVYWDWGNWSRWSDWDDYNPYNDYNRYDDSVDIEDRTVFRYKEK